MFLYRLSTIKIMILFKKLYWFGKMRKLGLAAEQLITYINRYVTV